MRKVIMTLAFLGLAAMPAAAQNFPAMGTDAVSTDAVDTDGSVAALGRQYIVDMLKSGSADDTWFSASFLAQIPIAEVNTVLGDVLQYAGPFKSIHGSKPKYTAVLTKHSFTVTIKFDKERKIDYLYFRSVN